MGKKARLLASERNTRLYKASETRWSSFSDFVHLLLSCFSSSVRDFPSTSSMLFTQASRQWFRLSTLSLALRSRHWVWYSEKACEFENVCWSMRDLWVRLRWMLQGKCSVKNAWCNSFRGCCGFIWDWDMELLKESTVRFEAGVIS